MALDPPPTHASSTSGSPPNISWHCTFVSRPIIAWKSRTCEHKRAPQGTPLLLESPMVMSSMMKIEITRIRPHREADTG